ncbi:MAG: glycosyltransferase family 1 protein [Candidatus Paceibacterota bacterium]
MHLVKLIKRKKNPKFNSIENVLGVLIPFLNIEEVLELPFLSKGVLNRIKNIMFLRRHNARLIHISGHDHYLLWYPFQKAILTIHDIEALKRKRGLKRWLFQKLWFDWPIRNAKVVTTISEFSKKEIQSINNYKTPIQVIYNPLTLPLIYTPKTFNTAKPRILHIGTKENKNLSRLIQALKGINCELIIIGKATESIKADLKTSEIDYTIKSNLSNEEMITEYKVSDFLAFVSTYEGFGLPILAAQAVGLPVLTSNVASMPEVAGEGALLVDPFSVKDIRKGILRLIEEGELRKILIQKGLVNINRFDVKIIAKQYNQLYKSALS